MNNYYVYIMTNKRNTVLYTGITNDIKKRIFEHKQKINYGFTSKYNINKLVYYEYFNDINEAIRREKQIKNGPRKKKINLINEINLDWTDLYKNINN